MSNERKITANWGGDVEPDAAFKTSEINHLRRLLAWIRVEYDLCENMQKGYARGALLTVEHGMQSEDEARQMLAERAEEINRVPRYVRQAVKMLSKKVSAHDAGQNIDDGVIVDGKTQTLLARDIQ